MATAFVSGARALTLQVQRATPSLVTPFGVLLGAEIANPGLGIPFYRDVVVEGQPLPFACDGVPVLRTSRLLPRAPVVVWLERHLNVTQAFLALGDAPFVMVVGAPNHVEGATLPDVHALVAILVRPGQGILLHAGTWHEFPFAVGASATVLTLNSDEVVDTLARTPHPTELDEGDVRKILVEPRLGVRIEVALDPALA